jgi:hypothetical protein
VYREFSGPGDRNGMGGVIGIDPTSWNRSLEKDAGTGEGVRSGNGATGGDPQGPSGPGQSTKLVILKKPE